MEEIKTGLQEKKPTTMHIVHLNKIILIFFFNKFLEAILVSDWPIKKNLLL
jgi:hypothetical protein